MTAEQPWHLSILIDGREITKTFPTFEAAASALLGIAPKVVPAWVVPMMEESLRPGPIARTFWTWASQQPSYRFLITQQPDFSNEKDAAA